MGRWEDRACFNDLVGKEIVEVRDHQGELLVATTEGSYLLVPEGDCCAHCYIEHIAGSDALAPGAVINEIRDVGSSTESEDYSESYSVSESWGHLFVTTKGYCTIEMRVDHNGYYGGSLEVSRTSKDSATFGEQLDDF